MFNQMIVFLSAFDWGLMIAFTRDKYNINKQLMEVGASWSSRYRDCAKQSGSMRKSGCVTFNNTEVLHIKSWANG